MYAQQPFHMCPSDRGNHGLSNTRSGSAAAGDCEMYGNMIIVPYISTYLLGFSCVIPSSGAGLMDIRPTLRPLRRPRRLHPQSQSQS